MKYLLLDFVRTELFIYLLLNNRLAIIYIASMSDGQSAPAATRAVPATTLNRGGNDVTTLADSAMRESSMDLEVDTPIEGLTATVNAGRPRRNLDRLDLEPSPLRSSWSDAVREATAIDINIAGFRIYFRLGALLIALFGLSFLYLIIQAKQITPVDTQRFELLSKLELKKNLGNAISNVTTEPLEAQLMPVDKMSTTQGRILFILAWCATISSTIDLLLGSLYYLWASCLVWQDNKRRRLLRRGGILECSDDPDNVLPFSSDLPPRPEVLMSRRPHAWRSPSFMLNRLAFDIASIYYLCTEATIAVCILIIGANSLVLASVRIPKLSSIIQIYHSIDEALVQAIDWITQDVSIVRDRLSVHEIGVGAPLPGYDINAPPDIAIPLRSALARGEMERSESAGEELARREMEGSELAGSELAGLELRARIREL